MTIDIFADIACPWCYIGEKRLFAALGQRNYDATVQWRPFQHDLENLIAITDSVSLDTDAAADYLASDAGRDEVLQSQQFAQRAGITGVPFTIIDDRLALSGAQPVETFVRALDQAATADAA